jgi:phospholipid/cholesterol/gamma-HCH transport system permease protein
VGDAVNQSVVITFMLLFVTNFVMTAVYFQVVPQRG